MALTTLIGGWILDVQVLRNVIPGAVEMKAWTAIGLVTSGVAVLAALRPVTARSIRLTQGLAFVPLLLGLVVGLEYLLGWDAGLDELLFRDETGRAQGIAFPGRFAPTTAGAFVMVGLSLLSFELRPWGRWRPAELLAIPVTIIGTVSIVGYLYAIPAFYGPASATKMAINTAVCFACLGLTILLSRPRGRLVRLVTTDDPGGILLRRLLPLAVGVPLLLGWLHLRSVNDGLLSVRVSTWWFVALTAGIFALLIVRVAGRLSAFATDRELLGVELERLANEDALTGLWNRRRFDEELAQQVSRCRRYGEQAGLIVLDLDGFKQINDSLGHHAGDELIRHVAGRLALRLRTSDGVGRLGGDEFGILLPSTSSDEAVRTAALIAGWLRRQPAEIAGERIPVTASVGVAFLGGKSADAATAMIAADRSMYEAKTANRDQRADAATHRVRSTH